MADVFPGAKLVQTNGFFARPSPDPNLVWSVVHTTAALASAELEASRRKDAASTKMVTATFFVNRDGSVVQLLADPARMAPWTNGVWEQPDFTNRRLAACYQAGVNPNLRSLITVENVSLEPGYPITEAQEAATARLIAHYHARLGVPVTRETVIGHYQITSINRPNCPARDKTVLDRIVALAQSGGDAVKIKGQILEWIVNRTTLLLGGATFLKDPTLPAAELGGNANAWRSFPAGQSFTPTVRVRGTAMPWQTDGNYLGGWSGLVGSPDVVFGYIAAAAAGRPEDWVQVENTGYTQAELEQAERTSFNEGVAAAESAVEAIPEK